jgi:2,3-bisphosphoglycerate-dependent phosphoglycerate mutase
VYLEECGFASRFFHCAAQGNVLGMRLYFIRHAQSTNNALWDSTGAENGRSDDPELTPLGARQAAALGDYLTRGDDPLEAGSAALTHLYCSPMTRAVQTALQVGRGAKLRPQIWEDWHESGGIWLEEGGVRVGREGKNRVYFQQHFADLHMPDGYAEKGWWSRAYETDAELFPRAQRVWRELLNRHGASQDRVAVVSHGHFYAFVMAVALGMPKLEGVFFVLNNTGVTRLDHLENTHKTTNLIYANRLEHLAPELVS